MDYLIEDDFFTMDPGIKRQWVEDLRSGTIKQARGRLHLTNGNMCCLGVLSHKAAQEGVVSTMTIYDHVLYDGLAGSLSRKTCEWAGLTKSDNHGPGVSSSGLMPFQDRNNQTVWLDDLNDRGFTFDQIADLIECFY